MSTTSRGAPYPADSDSNDVTTWAHSLATWVNDRPGIATLSTTQRNVLASLELWAGRVIYNTTTGRHERYNGTAWTDIDARARYLAFQRSGSSGASDQYSGTAQLVGGTWTAAPAGQYLLHTQVVLGSQSGNIPAAADFYVNGVLLDEIRMDVPSAFLATYTHVHAYTHTGGDLAFTMYHGVGAAIVTIMNGASGKCMIQYLGPA